MMAGSDNQWYAGEMRPSHHPLPGSPLPLRSTPRAVPGPGQLATGLIARRLTVKRPSAGGRAGARKARRRRHGTPVASGRNAANGHPTPRPEKTVGALGEGRPAPEPTADLISGERPSCAGLPATSARPAGGGIRRRFAALRRIGARRLKPTLVAGLIIAILPLINGCYVSNTEPRSPSNTRLPSDSEEVTGKPAPPTLKMEQQGRQLVFSWTREYGVDHYNLWESPGGDGDFRKIATDLDTLTYSIEITPRPGGWSRSRYRLEACNRFGCERSGELGTEEVLKPGIGYTRPASAYLSDYFGTAVALDRDGRTLVAGAPGEDSGMAGNPGDDSLQRAGAAYIFTYSADGGRWEGRAYLKATPSSKQAMFGYSVAVSDDGTVVAVGAPGEGDSSGAAYLFSLRDGRWEPAGTLRPASGGEESRPRFGTSVAFSGDGAILAVGAPGTDLPDGEGGSRKWAGSLYLYRRETDGWQPAGQLFPEEPEASAGFGTALAFGDDGSILAAGADGWGGTGAVFLFVRGASGADWSQEEVFTPGENTSSRFGASVSLSGDGNTLAVGAYREEEDPATERAGAAYIYMKQQGRWQRKQRLTPSNPDAGDEFGTSLALNEEGSLLVIGAPFEDSKATDLGGDGQDNSGTNSGATYLFALQGESWRQIAQVKPIGANILINERIYGEFGTALSVSRDGSILAVGAPHLVSLIQPQRGNPSEVLNATSGTGMTYLYALPLLVE